MQKNEGFLTKLDLNCINKTSFGLESPQLDFQYQESIQRYLQSKMWCNNILRRLILNKSGCLKTKSELSGELVTTFQMMKPQIDFQYLLRFQRNSLRNFDYDFREYPPFSEATKVENKYFFRVMLQRYANLDCTALRVIRLIS